MSMKAISFENDGVGLMLTFTDGGLQIKMGMPSDTVDYVIDLPADDVGQLANFIKPTPYPDGGCVMCHKSKDDVMVIAIAKTKSGGVCESCAVLSVAAAMKFAKATDDQLKLVARMAEAKQKHADKTDTKPEEPPCQE